MTQQGTGPQDSDSFECDRSELNENLEDPALVAFLRQNVPPVSESVELEDRLMQAIATAPIQESDLASTRARRPFRPRRLSIAAVLGIGVVALGVQLHRWFSPPDFSTAELSQLESYMVNDWDDTLHPPEVRRSWDWFDQSAAPTTVDHDGPAFSASERFSTTSINAANPS
jgi:hypothetical protein